MLSTQPIVWAGRCSIEARRGCLIRRADSARWEILRQQQVYEATLEQLESQRRQRGLGALNAGEREELDAILQELEVARQEAWQLILEGDEAISAEIALATSQAAKEEEWARRRARHAQIRDAFLGVFQNVATITAGVMEAQARMQELGGGSLPSASESWGSSDDLSTRQPAGGTHRDFVSNEVGWTLEELFDPLAIDPALVATKAVPSTSDLC